MFIRNVEKTNKGSEKKYNYNRLVESYRDKNGKSTNRILLNMGKLEIPKEQWKELAKKIEEKVYGKEVIPLIVKETDEENPLEKIAVHYSKILLKKMLEKPEKAETIKSKKENTTSPDAEKEKRYEEVDINSLKNQDARTIGAEYVGLKIWEEIELDKILRDRGLSEDQIKLAKIEVIGRMSHQGSERSTRHWAQEISAIGELLELNTNLISNNALYRISDKLFENKNEIESILRTNEMQKYGLEEKIILYDLTNTYFEGRCLKSKKAARSKQSKEKRTDCPLVTLGLIIDEKGFAKYSEVFEGNVSEPGTLEKMLKKIEKDNQKEKNLFTKKPTIVMDAGIATEDNLKLLKDKEYTYLVVARKKYDIEKLGGAKILENSVIMKEGVTAKIIKADDDETLVYCSSEGKKEKEKSIKTFFEKAFIEKLESLKKGLTKKGCTKKYDKILITIGRIKERYSKIAQYYDITIIEKNGQAIDIQWTLKTNTVIEERFDGHYFLQTNLKGLAEKDLWDLYITSKKIEDAFRIMKSLLCFRPNHHQIDNRIEGHLFICVLAYHLINIIYNKLKKVDIHYSWEHILKCLNTQVRITTSMTNKDSEIINIRNCSEPTDFQNEIYSALKIKNIPLPKAVLKRKK